MLSEVTIKNFRALRDVTLKLEPLTVLVGPNASGKSSILRVLDPAPASVSDVWKHNSSLRMEIGWLEAGELHPNRNFLPVSSTLPRPYEFAAVRFDLASLRSHNTLADQTKVDPTGYGLTNVFFALTRTQQTELAARFCSLVPVFRDVDTRAVQQGSHELRFQDRWNPAVWYGPSEVSDGSMLMLGYLLLACQRPRPTLLAIEEPERGLHPYLLGELINILRGLTTSGSPIQVILATHSAELLEYVKPEEVRFLTKNPEDGSVKIEQVETNTPNWKEAYEAHRESLGSVWLSGGLGGVPST